MTSIFLGRQPIYDQKLQLAAYELLYRSGQVDRANITNPDAASAQVILNAVLEIGLDQVVGPHLAFINLPQNLIVQRHFHMLPRERVVLEILEDVAADAAVVAALDDMIASGYRIALDDFVFRDERRPLVFRAHMIKLDIRALPAGELSRHVELCRRAGTRLVAEKIETWEELRHCQALGFDYFQGYFLSRPEVLTQRALPPSALADLQLLCALLAPDTDLERLEELICTNLPLSYKVLRLINAAIFNLPRRIESIREAVILLGLRRIRIWASLLLFAGAQSGDKVREILITAMVRARMCELLAMGVGEAREERFFTAGLLSLLPALCDRPLDVILPSLPLAEDIVRALLHGEGRIGEVLRCAVAYERGEWAEVFVQGLGPAGIREAYLASLRFAEELRALGT